VISDLIAACVHIFIQEQDCKGSSEVWHGIHGMYACVQEQRLQEKQEEEKKKKAADLKTYKNMFEEECMTSNREVAAKYSTAEEFEDDFM
jgi:hypothetical protein